MFTMKRKEMKECSKEWNIKGKKGIKVGEKRDYKKEETKEKKQKKEKNEE